MSVNQLSPGVQVIEKQTFGAVQAASSSTGAFVGEFSSGPAMQPILINNENTLLEVFGKPSQKNASSFLAAANFLSYAKSLYVVRAVSQAIANDEVLGTSGQTAASNASCSSADLPYDVGTNYNTGAYDASAVSILNADEYGNGFLNNIDSYNQWPNGKLFSYRYPGTMGNGIMLAIVDKGNIGLWNSGISARAADLTAIPPISARAAVPGLAAKYGSLPDITVSDRLHIVVIDTLGKVSGVPGTVLERFVNLSKNPTAVDYQGLNNYYISVIRDRSSYIYAFTHIDLAGLASGLPWGTTGVGDYQILPIPGDASLVASDIYAYCRILTGGNDGFRITASGVITSTSAAENMTNEIVNGWSLFDNNEIDVSLLISGNADPVIAKTVSDIAGRRRDCVAFVSICDTDGSIIIGGNSTDRLNKATSFKTAIGNSTYTVIDTGYKYQYDKYNDVYRWIALNSDIAGLCAKVDSTHDEWFSPAGLTKGQIKGVVKLSWNPNQAERDVLYPLGINPVVTFTGDGTVLFGDKTATIDASPFDRINVRRMFIGLEKAISRSARYRLFDQNDSITRSLWKSQVEPLLRDVKGRRGIEEFRVICDETNNPPAVVAANEFRGTILIKPTYSSNFIRLTFTSVGADVSFETAAGI